MPKAFAAISFTESVKAAQRRYGSRESNRGFELQDDARNALEDVEIEHIQSRDSFYLATVSENNWPYVQHRGGPVGFMRVLDAHTIGFADFSGNRQYLSVGNLNANARVALIFMDYPRRRRLKIWGVSRIVHEADEPELVARLKIPGYNARVERGIVIRIEALDWNCPQHITPRYSEAEVDHVMQPLVEENKKLREQARRQTFATPDVSTLGNGPLALVVSSMRQLTPRIRAYELRHAAGEKLPVVRAGAHLSIPVLLKERVSSTRNYSISASSAQHDYYEIAVLQDVEGAGGSRFVHAHFQLGTQLHCGLPRNDFALHADHRPAVLIAGGIGITPIKAMAVELKKQQRPFSLHYAGRSRQEMAYLDILQNELGEQLSLYVAGQRRLDLNSLMTDATGDPVFYVCGPQRLIADAQETAARLGIAETRLRFERFSDPVLGEAKEIEIELRRSGKTLRVPRDVSILSAVENAGIKTTSDCKSGNCGTCAVKVLEGAPLHRDAALTERDRTQGKLMCICVSRASSDKLVLDL